MWYVWSFLHVSLSSSPRLCFPSVRKLKLVVTISVTHLHSFLGWKASKRVNQFKHIPVLVLYQVQGLQFHENVVKNWKQQETAIFKACTCCGFSRQSEISNIRYTERKQWNRAVCDELNYVSQQEVFQDESTLSIHLTIRSFVCLTLNFFESCYWQHVKVIRCDRWR